MADEPSPPTALDSDVPEHDDGEVILAFFRRHGPWILFAIVASATFLGYGAYRESSDRDQRIEATKYLEEIVQNFHKTPLEKRKIIEEHLDKENVASSPLNDWFEFLLIRTHIEEFQANLIEGKDASENVLEKIDNFLDSKEHPQLTPFAYLSKAVFLEDIGKLEESQLALKQLENYPLSEAYHISQKTMTASSQKERYLSWQNYLNKSNP